LQNRSEIALFKAVRFGSTHDSPRKCERHHRTGQVVTFAVDEKESSNRAKAQRPVRRFDFSHKLLVHSMVPRLSRKRPRTSPAHRFAGTSFAKLAQRPNT